MTPYRLSAIAYSAYSQLPFPHTYRPSPPLGRKDAPWRGDREDVIR